MIRILILLLLASVSIQAQIILNPFWYTSGGGGSNVAVSSFDTKNGTSAVTHNLTSVPAGALLVVTTGNQNSNQNCTVSSSPSLTWTKQVDNSVPNAEIWTATFATGGTIDVTSNWGSNVQTSVCYVVTNQESTLAGASNTATGQASSNVALTTTRVNSLIFCVSTNWNAPAGTTSYLGSPTVAFDYRNATAARWWHYYYAAPTIQEYLCGYFSPTDGDNGTGTAVLEIRGN